MSTPNPTPGNMVDRKVLVGAAVGGLITFFSALLKQLTGFELETTAWLGLQTALVFGIQWWVPNQGASSSSHWLITLLIGLLVFTCIAGCTGTRLAYQQAKTLEQQAKVVGEHYYALQREANALKAYAPRDAMRSLQAADRAAAPVVVELLKAAQAYEALKTTQTEADLQLALDRAVAAVANFITAVNGAKERAQGITPTPPTGALLLDYTPLLRSP